MTEKIEKTARISSGDYHKLRENSEFDSIKQDANYEAFDSLSKKHREMIDRADRNLSNWKPDDSYFELNQSPYMNKIQYLRTDIFGISDCDFSEVDFSKEEFKEAIKEWNGRQLTLELQMVGIKEDDN